MNATRLSLFVMLAMAIAGCSSQKPTPEQSTSPAQPAAGATPAPAGQAAASQPGDEDLPPPANESALPEELRKITHTSFTGDFDQMVKRRIIRAGVPFNRTYYFIDKGMQRGLSYRVRGAVRRAAQ